MKKYLKLVLLLSLSSTWSCKHKEPEPSTRTQLLIGKKWQLRSSVFSAPGATDIDYYPLERACTKDDFRQFDLPNVSTLDEGPTKCSASYPQTQTGTWLLSSNDTKLTLSDQNFTDTYSIIRLTSDSLKMSLQVPQTTGPDATSTLTYVVIK